MNQPAAPSRSRAVAAVAVVVALLMPQAASARVSQSHSPAERAVAPSASADEVLVRLKAGARATALGRANAPLAAPRWRRVPLKAGETVEAAVARLEAHPAVAEASPNRIYSIAGAPDDTFFPLQWGLNNAGSSGSADIDALAAWSLLDGSDDVVVGVIDTGVAYDHPDLGPNIWTNPGELANGLDDDGNGRVDDIRGWDWYADDNDPYDENWHGTHVAAIVGARGNDGHGVAGVAHRVKIMPLRVLGPTGAGTTTDIADAIVYARQKGARIVNASLGGTQSDPYLRDVISASPGVLVVAAAGNGGSDSVGDDNDSTPTYPCSFPSANIVCVAASDASDGMAPFSNYGRTTVDLAAPGNGIPSADLPTSAASSGSYGLADSPTGGYASNSDSWAAPLTTFDLSGQSSCAVSYRLRRDLASGDQLSVERSTDLGSTWGNVQLVTGHTTGYSHTLMSASLSADNQAQVRLRFRLVSDASGNDDGVFIDQVTLACGSTTIWSEGFESDVSTTWSFGGTNNRWGRAKKVGEWRYASGTSMATPHVAGAAAMVLAYRPSASMTHVRNVLLGSVGYRSAFSGKTATGGRLNLRRALDFSGDVTPPSGLGVGGAASTLFQRSTALGLRWWASDAGPAGARKAYAVSYSRASHTGGFGSWAPWRTWTGATTGTFSATPGYTYCYVMRARDGALNGSGWSARRCTSVPLNDRSLSISSGWKRLSSSARYLGTYTYGTARGAKLVASGVRYKTLAVIATRCPTCGSIQVYRGSTLLKSVSLYSSTYAYKQAITVSSLSSVTGSSTITIKITSSGKPVMIEGLGVYRQ